MLSTWHENNQEQRILAAVPIVTAIDATMNIAKENGYELRVPNLDARNPANKPDSVESAALNQFKENKNLAEYDVFDKEMNAVRFFKPIRLTKDCMI